LYDVNLKRVLFHDRANSLAFEFGGSYHQLDWQGDLPGADLQTTQDVFFLTSAMSGHHVWDTARVAADVRLYADLGRIEDTTFPGQNRNFWDLGVDAFAWRPLDVPFLPGEQKVSAELVAQLSSTQLPSTRRLGLGGISGARGFSRDVYLADRGLRVRVDLRTPLSVGELSLFADAAYGETLNDDLDTWGRLVSVGVSWEAALGGIKSQLSWAVPVSTGGTGDVDDDGPQIFWSLRYVR
jgi:hemolysin activation/secretion protein